MTNSKRFLMPRAFSAAALSLAMCLPSMAETWSDNTGKFTIEAEFGGVEGKSVVLLKSGGQKVLVPISRLSADSRARAKALYQQMNSSGKAPAVPAAATPSAPRPARNLGFTPPVPPAVPPLDTFPDNMSVEETIAFIKKQMLAGRPDVYWFALPADIRETLDSAEIRDTVNPFVQEQSGVSKQISTVVFKAINVLVSKKQFVLGSDMMKMLPPDAAPMIQQGYDPAVGLAYEFTDLAASIETYGNKPLSEIVAYHAPRIGGHMKGLLALAPPAMIDSMLGAVEIEMIDENNALLKPPAGAPGAGAFGPPGGLGGPGGPEGFGGGGPEGFGGGGPEGFGGQSNEPMALTRYNGRWLPKGLVDGFKEYQTKGVEEIKSQIDTAQEAGEAMNPMLMVSMVVAPVNLVLDSLLAANTQEEFNAAIAQAQAQVGAMAGQMFGGMEMEMDAGDGGGFGGDF